MNENLRAKIMAKLATLDDEPGRQVLDYLEFLESKYNRSRRAAGALQRITENLEDSLGSVRLGEMAGRGVDAAGRLVAGIVAAGRTVAEELTASAPPQPEQPENGVARSTDDGFRGPPTTPPPESEGSPPPA